MKNGNGHPALKELLIVVVQCADADPGQVGKSFYDIRWLYWLLSLPHQLLMPMVNYYMA